jgi:hypothetical protein
MAFGGFVKKLQDEMEYLKHVKKATKGPLQGTYSYCIDKALTVEELNKVVERFKQHDGGPGPRPIGMTTSVNNDGTVNVAINMMEGQVLDEATGVAEKCNLINGAMVFEKPMSKDEIYESMVGMDQQAKKAFDGIRRFGKVFKNNKLMTYDEAMKDKDEDKDDTKYVW